MKMTMKILHRHLMASFVTAMIVGMMALFPITAQDADKSEVQENPGTSETSILEKIQWLHGPDIGKMEQWAQIQVPSEYVFASGADTRLLMESMGNPVSNTEVGFFGPKSLDWFVVFEFDEIGYIKDDDKDKLDAEAMLQSMKEGTEKGNQARRERGWPGLTILGWELAPRYNEETHNLEWAIKAEDDNGVLIINHNTRLLGRRGVMKSTLVAGPDAFSTVLGLYDDSLKGFSFSSGQKYTEFVQGDKIAKYGLTALVAGGAGVAVAKLGILQILGKYLKLILLGVIAILATVWKRLKALFSRKEVEVRQDLES